MQKINIEIELTEHQQNALCALFSYNQDNDFDSHGPLDLSTLVQMLIEDAAMTITRPGSWEGSNMRQCLSSHGYDC